MSLPDLDAVASQLHAMGYQPTCVETSFDAAGRITRNYEVQSMRPMRIPNGSSGWTPPLNLAVLSFAYPSEHWPERFSRIAGKFADALMKAFTLPGGPLIRRTARSVEIIWRLESSIAPRLYDMSASFSCELYPHGVMTRDRDATLVLCSGCPEIPAGGDAIWDNDRSPLNTPRNDLPEWNGDAVSAALVALVDRWTATGDLKVCDRYLEPSRTSASGPQGSEPSLSVDPASWDPADPRRKAPGLAARVRKLREDLMGGSTPSRRIDNDQLFEKIQEQRAATRGIGRECPWLD